MKSTYYKLSELVIKSGKEFQLSILNPSEIEVKNFIEFYTKLFRGKTKAEFLLLTIKRLGLCGFFKRADFDNLKLSIMLKGDNHLIAFYNTSQIPVLLVIEKKGEYCVWFHDSSGNENVSKGDWRPVKNQIKIYNETGIFYSNSDELNDKKVSINTFVVGERTYKIWDTQGIMEELERVCG